jgi:hypothetical protein
MDFAHNRLRFQNVFENGLNDDRIDTPISQGNLVSVGQEVDEPGVVDIEAHQAATGPVEHVVAESALGTSHDEHDRIPVLG